MVYVAQLAECLIVVQEVMGSTPIIHTTYLRSLMEKPQNTNLMIGSSTLSEGTTKCPFRITEVQHSSKVSGRSSNL